MVIVPTFTARDVPKTGLLRQSSGVAQFRLPQIWVTELTDHVVCQTITVLSAPP